MRTLLKVAIVGRPNVGKSALFNRIAERKISIVDEAEGVTRDRLYSHADYFGKPFTIIDTGGIDPRSKATFNEEVREQALLAIDEADSLILVVDGHVGMTLLDLEVAKILLQSGKPVCVAVNKLDAPSHEWLLGNFLGLGIEKVVPVSAIQGTHIAELLEAALAPFRAKDFPRTLPKDRATKVAIIGRPNTGKSTLVNYFLQEPRCIVSPIAGTTRDSIDLPFTWQDREYTLIDTAGIRRKQKETDVIEKFASIRTERAIERADVCVVMFDAQQGITTQEKAIINQIEEAGKGCVFFFNKWDLVHGFRMEHCLKDLEESNPFVKHCPKIFGSALTGRNVDEILDQVDHVYKALTQKITTGKLNKCIERALQKTHPAMIQGKRLRVYYMVQTAHTPPAFTLFVNYPELMQASYKKYLINQLRTDFDLTGVPVRFELKGKMKKEDLPQKINNN